MSVTSTLSRSAKVDSAPYLQEEAEGIHKLEARKVELIDKGVHDFDVVGVVAAEVLADRRLVQAERGGQEPRHLRGVLAQELLLLEELDALARLAVELFHALTQQLKRGRTAT